MSGWPSCKICKNVCIELSETEHVDERECRIPMKIHLRLIGDGTCQTSIISLSAHDRNGKKWGNESVNEDQSWKSEEEIRKKADELLSTVVEYRSGQFSILSFE